MSCTLFSGLKTYLEGKKGSIKAQPALTCSWTKEPRAIRSPAYCPTDCIIPVEKAQNSIRRYEHVPHKSLSSRVSVASAKSGVQDTAGCVACREYEVRPSALLQFESVTCHAAICSAPDPTRENAKSTSSPPQPLAAPGTRAGAHAAGPAPLPPRVRLPPHWQSD